MKGEEVSIRGMVVSYSPHSEDSAVCSLATDEGIVPLLLSHVFRPKSQLKPLLLVGSEANVLATKRSKGPYQAKQAEVVVDASSCLTSLSKSAFLLFLQEIAQKLFSYGDRFPYAEVSRIISSLLGKGDVLSLSLLFLGAIYRSLGIEIETSCCVRCKKTKDIVTFSLQEGGFLCHDCIKEVDGGRKDALVLYVLKYAFLTPDDALLSKSVPALQGREVLLVLADYLASYFDLKPFKSLSFLLQQCRDN